MQYVERRGERIRCYPLSEGRARADGIFIVLGFVYSAVGLVILGILQGLTFPGSRRSYVLPPP